MFHRTDLAGTPEWRTTVDITPAVTVTPSRTPRDTNIIDSGMVRTVRHVGDTVTTMFLNALLPVIAASQAPPPPPGGVAHPGRTDVTFDTSTLTVRAEPEPPNVDITGAYPTVTVTVDVTVRPDQSDHSAAHLTAHLDEFTTLNGDPTRRDLDDTTARVALLLDRDVCTITAFHVATLAGFPVNVNPSTAPAING